MNEYFSKDVKIEIPEDGIVLKHGNVEIAKIPAPDVEIVTSRHGVVLYLNLPITPENKKWVKTYLVHWLNQEA